MLALGDNMDLLFKDKQKPCFTQGTRICSAYETFERVWPLRHKMGITRLANITGLDTIGIPVYVANRPNSRALSLSQGKGITAIASKVSAFMESAEGFHAERISHPVHIGSYQDLLKEKNILDFKTLPQFMDSGFNEFTRVIWIDMYDIVNDTYKLVPYEAVSEDLRGPKLSGSGYFQSTSNGLASGNSKIEAINHGTTEAIERDSFRLWQLLPDEEQIKTKVDISTIKDKICRELLDKFEACNVAVGIWDITSDIEVPCFLCRIVSTKDSEKHSIRPASGMGCSLNAAHALSRALTEAAQSRLTFISGARDDIDARHYKEHTSSDHYTLWHESITACGKKPWRMCISNEGDSNTPTSYLNALIQKLKSVNLNQILTLDLSIDGIGIDVVKTVIPGLEGPPTDESLVFGKRAENQINLHY